MLTTEGAAKSSGLVVKFAGIYKVSAAWLSSGEGPEPDWTRFHAAPTGGRQWSTTTLEIAVMAERAAQADRERLRNLVETFVTDLPASWQSRRLPR